MKGVKLTDLGGRGLRYSMLNEKSSGSSACWGGFWVFAGMPKGISSKVGAASELWGNRGVASRQVTCVKHDFTGVPGDCSVGKE